MGRQADQTFLASMTVGRRLALVTCLVAVALVVTMTVSVLSFAQLRDELEQVQQESMPNVLIAKDLQLQVVQMQQWLTDISATRALDGLDDGFTEAERARARFLSGLDTLAAHFRRHDDRAGIAAIDAIRPVMTDWYARGTEMAQAYIDGGPAAGNARMLAFDEVSTRLQQALEPLIDGLLEDAVETVRIGVEDGHRVQWLVQGSLATAIVLLLAGGLLLARSISRPLNTQATLMTQITRERDFTLRVAARGRDEISAVGASFNVLVDTFAGLLGELARQAGELDHISTRLGQVSTASSCHANECADSTRVMAAAIEQMSSGLDQMSDNCARAFEIMQHADEAASEGGTVIRSAVDDLERISTEVKEVAGMIVTLGREIREIDSIVESIREVADQTNMLALNAAIEAARAGEQGRGFAVVADEVRKLAERSGSAAGEITRRIQSINRSAEAAEKTMDVALVDADTGTALGLSANEALNRIGDTMRSAREVFSDINSSVAEQAAAGQQLAQNVEVVAMATEANSQNVAQSAQAARQLDQLVQVIRKELANYRIGSTG